MKTLNSFFTLCFSIMVASIFTSCHKELPYDEKLNPHTISEKVTAWLDKHKSSNISTINKQINGAGAAATLSGKDANIELLKQNLDYANATTEVRDKIFDYLIVPIKEDVKTKKKLDKNSTLTLLVVTDKKGNIKWGNIVYFIPADGRKRDGFAPNTFQHMAKGKPINDDGVYKFLSITGTRMYEMEYKNNKMYSCGVIQAGKTDSTGTTKAKTNSGCIDWYLVTTYHFADGTTYQTEEYVGTTCGLCDASEYESLCPGSDGGGSTSTEEVYTVTETTVETNTDQYESDPEYSTGPGPTYDYAQLVYDHTYDVHYNSETGYIANIYIDPTRASPLQSSYVTPSGITRTRNVTLYGHYNYWTRITPTRAQVNWSCYVIAVYINSTMGSKYWSHSYVGLW